ncbi:MAG: hypothetical protein M3Z13_01045 [Candidatus Dormibacteraeota bacterium]|nr:hypothetical protein [Candidatus Dormibacteraeota bacterium]
MGEHFEIEMPGSTENLNMACFAISRALDDLAFSVPQAALIARHLLRVVGRIIIDTSAPGADPEVWQNTEAMTLLWLREALVPIGYDIQPIPGSGRGPVPEPSEGWV